MPGKRYSAGAIFLQVVPVFANVQRAIQDEAKGWDRTLGDEMEKAGDRAGERAGKAASKRMREEMDKGAREFSGSYEREFNKSIDNINRSLDNINTNKLSNNLRSELSKIKKELADLKNVDITVDVDRRRAEAALAELEGRLRALRDGAKIVFRADIDKALRDFAKIEAAKEAISDPVEIKVKADTSQAERAMTSFEKVFKKRADAAAQHLSGSMHKEVQRIKDDLVGLQNLRIGVDISANQARRELAELGAELAAIAREDPNIDVKVDAGRAFAEIAALEAALRKIDGQDVNINTDKARRNLFSLSRDGEDASNTFRAFNGILLAAVGLGPALVPVLAAIAGGLLALGPAAAVAGAGIGSVLIGFSGLGNALTALQNRQDQQAKNAQTAAKQNQSAGYAIRDAQRAVADAERNAARAAEDAAQRVADARRQAADSIRNALEQQRSAQQSYADSVREVQQAEADLQQARRDAASTGQDLANKIAENQLAMQQGLLDEFNSKVAYDTVRSDGSSTNAEIEQARINWEQAKLRQTELRQQQKELAAEKKKWDKQGVEGTDAVQSAEDRLRNALEQQRQAYQQLHDAARAVDQARAEGARNVKRALEDQNRTLADNRRSIERAREAVGRARQSQDELNTSITSQDQAVQAAFSKLGPAGRRFALFLFGLRKQFYAFRNDIQQAMLPSIQSAIEGFLGSGNFKVVRSALVALAGGFGRFVKALSRSFQGKVWGEFFKMLHDYGPVLERVYGHAFIKFLEGMASILTTLAPFSVVFAKAVAQLADKFARWAKSKAGQKVITDFLAYIQKIGPDVWRFVVDLAGALVNLLKALAPWGESVLKILDGLLKFIANMDPKTLGQIATAIVLVITASQVAYAIMSLVLSASALLSSWIGIVIFAVIGLIGVMAYLWNENEGFRKFAKNAWKQISDAFKQAWKYMGPALADLGDALKELWKKIMVPFFKWLGPILVNLIKVLLPAFGAVFAGQIHGIAWLIRHVFIPMTVAMWKIYKWLWDKLKKVWKAMGDEFWDFINGVKWGYNHTLGPTFKAIGAAAKFMWQKVIKPVWAEMKDNWHELGDSIKWVWDHTIKWVWDFITQRALPKLKSAFRNTVDDIKDAWNNLKQVVGAPVKFVLDTILNHGLIDSFNKVADWVHMPNIAHIPIPKGLQSYATGGIMPGYTPGRDVHKFYSPTGGRLELSGGEAILRPEATSALGPGWVNSVNHAAISGGVEGVRKALGFASGGVMRFAKGGILDPDSKVYINGMAISRIAAAQVALAKKISHIPIYMMQGGYGGNHIAASGSSHNYPGVGDFGPGSIALETIMRKVGFAAWARNVAGRSQVGSGAHVHAVSLLDPGDRSSPQVYGSWANHGNGLSGYGNDPAPHYAWIPGLVQKIASMGIGDIAALVKGGGGIHLPGWVSSIIKDPLGAVKGWITGGWDKAGDFVKSSPAFDFVKKVPLLAAKKVTDKVWDVIPGWAKTAAGWAGDAAHWVVGGVKSAGHAAADAAGAVGHAVADGAGAVGDFLGFANGGILPYNGTMKYDTGGYLPPGLTSVVNLTGSPEPVFTAEQFKTIEGGGASGSFHYEPHFEGSDLTAEDVAGDLNFTFRRLRRGGVYAGMGRR